MILVDQEGSGKFIELLQDLGDDLFSLFVTSEAVQFAGLLPQKKLIVDANPQLCLRQEGRTRFLPISLDLCFVKFCIFGLPDVFRINILIFSYLWLNVQYKSFLKCFSQSPGLN